MLRKMKIHQIRCLKVTLNEVFCEIFSHFKPLKIKPLIRSIRNEILCGADLTVRLDTR